MVLTRTSLFFELLEVFLPEVFALLSIILFLLTFFNKNSRLYLTNFFCLFFCYLSIFLALIYSTHSFNYENILISTNLIWFSKFFLLSCCIIFSVSHFFQIKFAWKYNNLIDFDLGSKYFEVNLFTLIALFVSFVTIMTNDFLIFLVGLEVLSILFYIITGLTYERTAVESALKYFFPGIFFSLFILLGIVFIFWGFGTGNFSEIIEILRKIDNLNLIRLYDLKTAWLICSNDFSFLKIILKNNLQPVGILDTLIVNNYLLHYNIILNFFQNLMINQLKWLFLGLCLVFLGLFGKLGIFPGHFWVLEVYGNMTTLSNFFLATFPKFFYIILLIKLRLAFDLLFLYTPLSYFFLSCGFLSVMYGLLVTLNQWRIKRFLAGSSIVNISYIILLFGIPVNFDLKNLYCAGFFQITLIYFSIVVYIISISIFFFNYLILRQPSNIKINYYLDDFRELILLKSNVNFKFILIILSLLFLSFAGVPPLLGFFNKFLLFEFLLIQKQYIILIIILIASIISAFYYLRIIRFLLFNNTTNFNLFIIPNLSIILIINIIFYFFYFLCYFF